MEKVNPNPICQFCGKHASTIDCSPTRLGKILVQRWVTQCGNYKCSDFYKGESVIGVGVTVKSARQNYRENAAKVRQGGDQC